MTTEPHESRSAFGQFWAEMKRRHVVRFAIGYAAAAFVVLQIAEIVMPAFGLGDEWLRLLVIITAVGFPPALLLAWVFDVTPQGLKRTEELSETGPASPLLPRLALMGATFGVVIGLAFWLAGSSLAPGEEGSPRGSEGPLQLVAYDPTQPIRALAVLPLENQSEGADGQDYFTAGMQEELITQLSQIAGLRVASRTSTARYAEPGASIPSIARELGVDAVIEGAILRVGDQVRINVVLYHAASETQIWSESFDRELDDIFALQSEVALHIAEAVQGQVSPEDASLLERTAMRDVDPAAADAYLRGRWEAEKGTPDGYRAAMEHFETAVQADSGFAPAMASLAGSRFLLSMAVPGESNGDVERALREAQMALSMDSMSWEAREVLTFIAGSRAGSAPVVLPAPPATAAPGLPRGAPRGTPRADPSRATTATVGTGVADPDTRLAVIRIPGMGDSLVLDLSEMDSAWASGAVSRMGQRIEEQVRRAGMARNAGVGARIGGARQLMLAGRFDDAADVLEGVVDDRPEEVHAWELWSRAEATTGDATDAADVLVAWARSGAPGAPSEEEAARVAAAVSADGPTAYWRWLHERLLAARDAGRRLPLTDLAATEAALGLHEQALETLVEALRRGEREVVGLPNDPVWDGLRSDSRFLEILRQTRAIRLGRPPRS